MKTGEPLACRSAAEWEAWLEENHASAKDVWLRLARKGADTVTVTRSEAVELALCYGWIDGQAASGGDAFWLQRFTPRTPRSKWSRINCDAAEILIRTGRMKPSGLAAVQAAQADGRWAAAYASPRAMAVPADLLEKLREHPAAEAFFSSLDARNRYSILYRIQDAKKPETRARRIEKFVAMLERGETIH